MILQSITYSFFTDFLSFRNKEWLLRINIETNVRFITIQSIVTHSNIEYSKATKLQKFNGKRKKV